MRIEFSQLPGLQYITDKKQRYEAVHTPDGPEIYKAGTNERAQLPEHVTKEIARRFAEIHLQDPYTQELYLMEAKPCSI
jgi:hypothetical protein